MFARFRGIASRVKEAGSGVREAGSDFFSMKWRIILPIIVFLVMGIGIMLFYCVVPKLLSLYLRTQVVFQE